MLGPQKMSERLRETQRFFEPKPPTLFIRIWHIMNGSVLAALVALSISISSYAARFFYDIKDHSSLFFSMGFLSVVFPMVHLSLNRMGYVRVSETTFAAAEALEAQVNNKQMQRMKTLARLSRILIALFFIDISMGVGLYWVLPLWRRSLNAPLPFLPEDPIYFWSMYLVQSVVLTLGPMSALSLLVFHLEVSLCLSCMYNILGERFQMISKPEGVGELIRIHQLLLKASKTSQRFFSVMWFSLVFELLSMLIVNTYILIALSFQVFLLFLITTFFAFLCEPCILGEMVANSSRNIGFSVYASDWVNTVPELRRDLSLVIFRSLKPVYVSAGLIGPLNLQKLMLFVNNWYKIVQALLNFK